MRPDDVVARRHASGAESPAAVTFSVLSVAILFAIRFRAFLLGGVLYRRDAGFFFVPWREVLSRLLSRGEAPVWNEWLSSGRPFAADPNAAVFWPLSPLVVLLGPTRLEFLNLAVVLVLFFLALRLVGLRAVASAAGAILLLFAGVFQSLTGFFGATAALAPLPLAVAALATLDPLDRAGKRRRIALASAALGLSFLGGEPLVTAMGAVTVAAVAGFGVVRDFRAGNADAGRRRGAAFLWTGVLALALAAVQLLPAAGELARSARWRGDPEAGALYWSVRPGRILTLLEPRLVGDPGSETPEGYWGAGTFDAGNPYFLDLSIGAIPLALALSAAATRRGRAALALAALSACLSFGRFLPGFGSLAAPLAFFRYPEKWWLIAIPALAAAAAIGLDALLTLETRERSLRVLSRSFAGLAAFSGVLLVLALLFPSVLRSLLWSAGLGAGPTSPAVVALALRPAFLSTCASLALVGGLASLARRGKGWPAVLVLVAAALFLADASRRVAGSCPAGSPDLYSRSSLPRFVSEPLAQGRFYDDGADRATTVVRRSLEGGGLDPLRPATGVFRDVRYAAENDVDRMTSVESFQFAERTAQLPWGEAKLARLRAAGVTVVRTDTPVPGLPGVFRIGSRGGDLYLGIERARPEISFAAEAVSVSEARAAGALLERPGHDPVKTAIVEEGAPRGPFGGGRVESSSRSSSRDTLRVAASAGGALLVLTRTWHPCWIATLDGRPTPFVRTDGVFSSVFVPEGVHTVELRFSDRNLWAGGIVTALAAIAVLVLARRAP